MLLWRIAREPHVDTTLEGVGGLMVSGRWHRRGHPILYASSTAALVALEVLVHMDPLQAPDDLRLLGLDLPDDLEPSAGTGKHAGYRHGLAEAGIFKSTAHRWLHSF
jgi:RES domain-containing protein